MLSQKHFFFQSDFFLIKMFRVFRRPLASVVTHCSFSACILNPAPAVRSMITTTDANAQNLQQKPPTCAAKVMASAPELYAVLRQLQAENRMQTGDEDFPECSPAWFNTAVNAIDHRFCTLPTQTKKLFSTFVKNQRKYLRGNTIALIPGTKGSGRTTLLQMFSTSFDHVANMASLYLSDAIVYDATDPRLSFGDSSFIKLQYRVLHAATGAPPHAFGTTVLALRRRLGLEAWFAFPNDVLFEAVRNVLSMNLRDYILVAVDDVHVSCPAIRAENVGEDLLRLLKTEEAYGDSLVIGVAATAHKIEGETNIMGWNPIQIHVPNSHVVKDKHGNRIYLLTAGAPNPNPRIAAAIHFLRLSFNSHRADEVRYMLRHAAVHARFLADTYHQICGGGLTSVADFDAQFNAFVSPRIDQFLTYCREKHLDPMRLFDDIFLARPASNTINPLTVAADAVGLCTLMGVCASMEKQHTLHRKIENKKKRSEESEEHAVYVHPKVFVMLHGAVFISGGDATPPPRSTMLSILLALARLTNAFTALETTAPVTTLAAAPLASPARCPVHFQSDVALLMMTAILARAADESSRCKNNNTLTDLFPGWKSHVSEEAIKDAMVRCMDPAHMSYAAMLASHTLAQGDGPLYSEGMPRAVYSFSRFDDAGVLLSDPSAAPALLRSMAAHGLIRGALHGLDVWWDVNHQIRGSLTLGVQAIAAASKVERTADAIAEHRARRAEWAEAFAGAGDQNPHEKTAAACDLLKTNIFVHVFVVDGQHDKCLHYTPEPFTVGGVQCFELMISMADLQQRWPMAARISALDGRDGCGRNSETIREVVIEDDNEEEDYDDYDDDD